ncbi:MAG: hypothetical protein JXD19_05040 [Deltaproteobacteria bacterium]|nr:hypothetical protein [Deltaproteobacteria bacterium]
MTGIFLWGRQSVEIPLLFGHGECQRNLVIVPNRQCAGISSAWMKSRIGGQAANQRNGAKCMDEKKKRGEETGRTQGEAGDKPKVKGVSSTPTRKEWSNDLTKWEKRGKAMAKPLKGRKFAWELFYFTIVFSVLGAFIGFCFITVLHAAFNLKVYFGLVYTFIFFCAIVTIATRSKDRFRKLWLWSSVNAYVILMLIFGRLI